MKMFILRLILIIFILLPTVGFSQTCPIGYLCNPLTGNIQSIADFIRKIVDTIVLPVGSVIVVFFIIYAGFLFVTARGNETKLGTAKRTFLWVIIGSAILLGSWVLAHAISVTLCQITSNNPNSCQ